MAIPLLITQSFTITVAEAPDRVVMVELFVAPACSRCPSAKQYMAQLLSEYGFEKMVLVEEYGWNYPLALGWATTETTSRFSSYCSQLGLSIGSTPDAYFDGLNQYVHHDDSSYANYKAAIEAELNKPCVVTISASYNITGYQVN